MEKDFEIRKDIVTEEDREVDKSIRPKVVYSQMI